MADLSYDYVLNLGMKIDNSAIQQVQTQVQEAFKAVPPIAVKTSVAKDIAPEVDKIGKSVERTNTFLARFNENFVQSGKSALSSANAFVQAMNAEERAIRFAASAEGQRAQAAVAASQRMIAAERELKEMRQAGQQLNQMGRGGFGQAFGMDTAQVRDLEKQLQSAGIRVNQFGAATTSATGAVKRQADAFDFMGKVANNTVFKFLEYSVIMAGFEAVIHEITNSIKEVADVQLEQALQKWYNGNVNLNTSLEGSVEIARKYGANITDVQQVVGMWTKNTHDLSSALYLAAEAEKMHMVSGIETMDVYEKSYALVHQLNLSYADLPKVYDQIAYAAKKIAEPLRSIGHNGREGMKDILVGVSEVGAVLKDFGVDSKDEMSAAAGSIAIVTEQIQNMGKSGEGAGHGLASMLGALASFGAKRAEFEKILGKDAFKDTKDFLQAMDRKAPELLQAMADGKLGVRPQNVEDLRVFKSEIKDIIKLYDDLNKNAHGALDEATRSQIDLLNTKFKQLQSNVQAASLAIGLQLEGRVSHFLDVLNGGLLPGIAANANGLVNLADAAIKVGAAFVVLQVLQRFSLMAQEAATAELAAASAAATFGDQTVKCAADVDGLILQMNREKAALAELATAFEALRWKESEATVAAENFNITGEELSVMASTRIPSALAVAGSALATFAARAMTIAAPLVAIYGVITALDGLDKAKNKGLGAEMYLQDKYGGGTNPFGIAEQVVHTTGAAITGHGDELNQGASALQNLLREKSPYGDRARALMGNLKNASRERPDGQGIPVPDGAGGVVYPGAATSHNGGRVDEMASELRRMVEDRSRRDGQDINTMNFQKWMDSFNRNAEARKRQGLADDHTFSNAGSGTKGNAKDYSILGGDTRSIETDYKIASDALKGYIDSVDKAIAADERQIRIYGLKQSTFNALASDLNAKAYLDKTGAAKDDSEIADLAGQLSKVTATRDKYGKETTEWQRLDGLVNSIRAKIGSLREDAHKLRNDAEASVLKIADARSELGVTDYTLALDAEKKKHGDLVKDFGLSVQSGGVKNISSARAGLQSFDSDELDRLLAMRNKITQNGALKVDDLPKDLKRIVEGIDEFIHALSDDSLASATAKATQSLEKMGSELLMFKDIMANGDDAPAIAKAQAIRSLNEEIRKYKDELAAGGFKVDDTVFTQWQKGKEAIIEAKYELDEYNRKVAELKKTLGYEILDKTLSSVGKTLGTDLFNALPGNGTVGQDQQINDLQGRIRQLQLQATFLNSQYQQNQKRDLEQQIGHLQDQEKRLQEKRNGPAGFLKGIIQDVEKSIIDTSIKKFEDTIKNMFLKGVLGDKPQTEQQKLQAEFESTTQKLKTAIGGGDADSFKTNVTTMKDILIDNQDSFANMVKKLASSSDGNGNSNDGGAFPFGIPGGGLGSGSVSSLGSGSAAGGLSAGGGVAALTSASSVAELAALANPIDSKGGVSLPTLTAAASSGKGPGSILQQLGAQFGFKSQTGNLGGQIGGALEAYQGYKTGGIQGAFMSAQGAYSATGNPYIAAGAALLALFSHHDDPAKMPDKYNTQEYGQFVANIQGAGGSANGKWFDPDPTIMSATGNKGEGWFIHDYIASHTDDQLKSVFGSDWQSIKSMFGQWDARGVYNLKDGQLSIGSGRYLWSDIQNLGNEAMSDIVSTQGVTGTTVSVNNYGGSASFSPWYSPGVSADTFSQSPYGLSSTGTTSSGSSSSYATSPSSASSYGSGGGSAQSYANTPANATITVPVNIDGQLVAQSTVNYLSSKGAQGLALFP